MTVLLVAILGCIIVVMLMVLVRKTAADRGHAEQSASTTDTNSGTSTWNTGNDAVLFGGAATNSDDHRSSAHSHHSADTRQSSWGEHGATSSWGESGESAESGDSGSDSGGDSGGGDSGGSSD
jgi:hypothetical protein